MVDQLASEYGSQVIFLEQYYQSNMGNRLNRFWAAFGSGTANYPWIIVDSGHQVSSRDRTGTNISTWHDFYKGMIDAELARPPQAEITATYTRVANHFHFQVQVKNTSGVALSSGNGAALTAMVYEDMLRDPDAAVDPRVTSRYVRDGKELKITLANNENASYTLDSAELSGVNWGKLHAVVFVDYRPGGSSGRYDMLQAAVATSQAPLSITPNQLSFMVRSASPADQSTRLSINGATGATWTISNSLAWLAVTPASGQVGTAATIQVLANKLSPGWQKGAITVRLTQSGTTTQQDVPVQAYLGQVWNSFTPVILR